MIIFAGDYVKTRADGAWHLVKHTMTDMLILLDNGFLTYAHELHVDAVLSADEFAAALGVEPAVFIYNQSIGAA